MKRKANMEQLGMRELSDLEMSKVAGGQFNYIEKVSNLKSEISPDRKNREVVPTAGIELATY